MSAERLNVLLIILDGVRADHVSCSGYRRETTPFLDTLARQGVRFPHMIATAPWSLPAHAALLTGLFSVTHGATDENRFLSVRHKVLPEILKTAGYRTAAFCTNPWVSPDTGFGRGFDVFSTQRSHRLARRALGFGRHAGDTLLRRADAGARRSNQALRRWLASGDQPFFAVVHYGEARLPVHPPPPYERLFLPRGTSAARLRNLNQDSAKLLAGAVEMGEEDFTILTALYDGALRYVDTRVREVADLLKARGAWDDTLFIVTADHGQHLGDHGALGNRFTLYDGVLRVPLVLRCPARIPQGFVVEELVQSTDIAPTILGLVDLPAGAEGMQGRHLLEGGRATTGPAFAIAERFRPNLAAFQRHFPQCDTRPFDVRKKAIRTPREKFIWQSDEANALYDLAADPDEAHNLIDAQPERAEALRRQLFDWLANVDKAEIDEQGPALGEQMRQQLQGLGYID